MVLPNSIEAGKIVKVAGPDGGTGASVAEVTQENATEEHDE